MEEKGEEHLEQEEVEEGEGEGEEGEETAGWMG